jgi:electron transfer flavoprotein alpha subunit
MAGVLVFGEVYNGSLTDASLEAVAAGNDLAQQLGSVLLGGLIGAHIGAAADSFLNGGMSQLFVADDARFEPYTGEQFVAAAAAIVDGCAPSVVLFPHSPDTREWVPQLAARLDAGLTTDCTSVAVSDGQLLMTKPIYGGSVMAEYRATTPIALATLRAGSFEAAPAGPQGEIVTITAPAVAARVAVVDEIAEATSEGPRLKTAKAVVSGGLGVGGPEHWHLIEETASVLGAAVGATRAVTDLNWVPSHHQVGLTGTNVAPDLYVAIGISGAIQHMAGITQARTVVAINRDPEANIFSVARFGAVGDAKEIVPAFVERLRELRG